MPKIFISYRRQDSAGHAGRLYDFLVGRYGDDCVFMDIAAIAPGEDFVVAIERVLKTCSAVVVLIGREWLNARDEGGGRKLDDPADFVRMELSASLSRPELAVFPALVAAASMPKIRELPKELESLSRRNAIELSDERWAYDCHRLTNELDKVVKREPSDGKPTGDASSDQRLESPGWATDQKPPAYNASEKQQQRRDPLETVQAAELEWSLLPRKHRTGIDHLPMVNRLSLEIGPGLTPVLAEPEGDALAAGFLQHIETNRDTIRERFGIRPGGILVDANDELPANTYIIMINDIPLVSGSVLLGARFCPQSTKVLRRHRIDAEEASCSFTGGPGSWVEAKHWRAVSRAGFELWEVAEYVARHVMRIIEVNLAEFLGTQEVYDSLLADAPDAAQPILESGGLPAFRRLWMILLEDGIPLVPMVDMAAVFLEGLQEGIDTLEMADRVRRLPAVQIRLHGNREGTRLYRLSDHFIMTLTAGIRREGMMPVLALLPEDHDRLLKALRANLRNEPGDVVVLGNGILRRAVRKLLEMDLPELGVLAEDELIAELQSQPRTEIDLA